MEAEVRLRAMGTDVHILITGGRPGLAVTAGAIVLDLERRWSRFRADSELSEMNRLAGTAVRVSPETATLVELALEGARITNGRFDPTVLGDVIRAGYDRSFELLNDGRPATGSTLSRGYEGVVVDTASSTVLLPPGVGFDPGGIGKGYAADLAVAEILALGAAGACVSIGGDLRAEGEAVGGGAWKIALEHPTDEDPAALIGLAGGAVATSTSVRRTWGPDGHRRHHLIDPSTGVPARTGVLSATAIAAQAWRAEVLAKAAFVAGVTDGPTFLTSAGADGLVVDGDGAVHATAGLGSFTRGVGALDRPTAPMAEAIRP